MNVNVLLAGKDADYLKRLADIIKQAESKTKYKIHCVIRTDIGELRNFLSAEQMGGEKEKYQIAVIDEEADLRGAGLDDMLVIILTEESGRDGNYYSLANNTNNINDKEVLNLYKYQRLSGIADKIIIKLTEEKDINIKNKAAVYAFFSPHEGGGASTVATAGALFFRKTGINPLYICLRTESAKNKPDEMRTFIEAAQALHGVEAILIDLSGVYSPFTETALNYADEIFIIVNILQSSWHDRLGAFLKGNTGFTENYRDKTRLVLNRSQGYEQYSDFSADKIMYISNVEVSRPAELIDSIAAELEQTGMLRINKNFSDDDEPAAAPKNIFESPNPAMYNWSENESGVKIVIDKDMIDKTMLKTMVFSKPPFVPDFMHTEQDFKYMLTYNTAEEFFVKLGLFNPAGNGITPYDFMALMKNLTDMLTKCEDYSMNPRNFIIHEDYIYVNSRTFDVRLVYVPFKESVYSEKEICENIFKISRRIVKPSEQWNAIVAYLFNIAGETSIHNLIEAFGRLYDEYILNLKPQREQVFEQAVRKKEPEPEIAAEPEKETAENIYDTNDTNDTNNKNDTNDKNIYVADDNVQSIWKDHFDEKNINNMEDFTNILEKEVVDTSVPYAPLNIDKRVSARLDSITPNNQKLPKVIRIETRNGLFSIGRVVKGKSNCDYCFPDVIESISRKHAQIKEENGRYFISDMNSTNGTFVERQRISPNQVVELKDGDVISFSMAVMYEFKIERPRL